MDTTAIPGDIHASKAHLILGVSIALLILSFIAVALRLLARRLSGAGLWWDDWLIIAALVNPIRTSASKSRPFSNSTFL